MSAQENSTTLKWMRLDNAAKIYPAAKRRNWSNLFRVSATLTEKIDTGVLQSALDTTVKRFPSIAVRLRRGMFWYCIEDLERAPRVIPDEYYPCTRMSFKEIKTCAFRVLYYENRIAVEFFHALTDGNGGLIFLKTLLAEYLLQKYGKKIPPEQGVLDRNEPPAEEEFEDSFLKYEGNFSTGRSEATAYKLKGTYETDGYVHITTGILSAQAALECAKKYNTSLTAFLAAVLIDSIIEIQNSAQPNPKRQKPVKVLIPVNLRKLFPSRKLRNFVLYITPGVDPKMGSYTFEEIVKSVHHQMGMELTSQRLSAKITKTVRSEKALFLKIMPLFVKNIAMKLVYNMVGEKKSCITLSNLGVVAMPRELAESVKRMDFILGMQAQTHNNCGVVCCGGKIYINFARNIEESTLERLFFTRLVKMGIHVKVESNHKIQ